MSQSFKRTMAIVIGVLFLLSLIPMFIIALYNHPSIDDFYYGIKTYHAVQDAGSLPQILSAAVEQVKETYQNWQGTFSAVFLFALHPAVFQDSLYSASTFLLLPAFLFSSLFLWKVLLRDCCKAPREAYWIISLVLLGCSIQFMPSPVQGFYWWNGSIYYTFFYSLSCLCIGLVLKVIRGGSTKKMTIRTLLSSLLAVIIGGGNYVTALITALLLVCGILYLWKRRDKKALLLLLPFIFTVTGLMVSMAAPGNAVRAERYADYHTPSVIGAIFQSFFYAFHFFTEWTTPSVFLVFVLLSPIAYSIAKRLPFSFRYPLLVTLVTFCLFAAQFSPTCYGMASYGEERVLNIIYFSYYWLVFLNIFYYAGWINQKLQRHLCVENPLLLVFTQIKKRKAVAAALLLVLLFLPITQDAEVVSQGKFHYKEAFQSYTSASAAYSLLTGEAEQYDKEYEERLVILEDPSVKSPVFTPYTAPPYVLYYGDLTEDPAYEWSNEPMRRYYNKESIIVDWHTK